MLRKDEIKHWLVDSVTPLWTVLSIFLYRGNRGASTSPSNPLSRFVFKGFQQAEFADGRILAALLLAHTDESPPGECHPTAATAVSMGTWAY
jgi:hypothetical protein